MNYDQIVEKNADKASSLGPKTQQQSYEMAKIPTIGCEPGAYPQHLRNPLQQIVVASFINGKSSDVLSMFIYGVFPDQLSADEFIQEHVVPIEQRVKIVQFKMHEWQSVRIPKIYQTAETQAPVKVYCDPNLQKIMSSQIAAQKRNEADVIARKREIDEKQKAELKKYNQIAKERERKGKEEAMAQATVQAPVQIQQSQLTLEGSLKDEEK